MSFQRVIERVGEVTRTRRDHNAYQLCCPATRQGQAGTGRARQGGPWIERVERQCRHCPLPLPGRPQRADLVSVIQAGSSADDDAYLGEGWSAAPRAAAPVWPRPAPPPARARLGPSPAGHEHYGVENSPGF